LPVIDRIAADYRDDVTSLAVAGRGSLDRTQQRAAELFSDNLLWGFDESIWELYAVFGQPFTVLVSGDDVIVDSWFGRLDESELRGKLEGLVAASA